MMFYRVYSDPARLEEILNNRVIPKMYRDYHPLARLEDDAVFLATSIHDALILCPDTMGWICEREYWNRHKGLSRILCEYYPNEYKKLHCLRLIYAISIKPAWLDTTALKPRINLRCTEYLYPKPIMLPERPQITEIRMEYDIMERLE